MSDQLTDQLTVQLTSQLTPGPAMTQKSERKATAAAANDATVFQHTKFGRMRVPSLPVRLIVAIIALPVLLPLFAYRLVLSTIRRGKGKTRESRQGEQRFGGVAPRRA